MRKVIVFFDGAAPYLIEMGEHLAALRLEYPNGERADLQIFWLADTEDYAFAADRNVDADEVRQAAAVLI
ncbi:Uncharacterised protein [Serratia fonticola]|uniref:hypothetical protein n=1 Tax=Serratia fonticola TaxID=47917 RepID=UPI00217B1E86|nr:hypothetical protein [Serratia fonticola]CAI2035790.1 Uncharacterised protein [Serratia fonticola]